MSLKEILDLSSSRSLVKDEVSEQRLKENLDALRDEIAFFREYPDIFVDTIKGPDCTFSFRFTQRIFLRSIMRHRYVYCVFTRGFSKSFLAIMALMLKAILFPGSKVFVTTGGKLIFIYVLNFLNWIYKDATIYLDRKYEHYLDFINNGSKYHKAI